MVGKHLRGQEEAVGLRTEFNTQTSLGSSLSTHLAHATVTSGDGSLPKQVLSLDPFRQLGERSKFLPESFEPL